nr:MAG TPA: hypothetical protein [Caudoviricetes sp.]DAT07333.1 MAG TPA: hypothetical protein [Caudoviricetes sp.]
MFKIFSSNISNFLFHSSSFLIMCNLVLYKIIKICYKGIVFFN